MQIPLVALTVGSPESGTSAVYVLEYVPGFNYIQLQSFLSSLQQTQKDSQCSLSKSHLKDVLKLATDDRERACIRYTAFKASGLSATAARKHFGFDNLTIKTKAVEEAIQDREAICMAIDNISKIQEKALMMSYADLKYDSSSSSDTDSDCYNNPTTENSWVLLNDPHLLYDVIEESSFNWFEVVNRLDKYKIPDSIYKQACES